MEYNFNVTASTADFMFDFYILKFSKLNKKRTVNTYMKIQNKQKLHSPPRMYLCIRRWTTSSSTLKAQWWKLHWYDLDAVNSAPGRMSQRIHS